MPLAESTHSKRRCMNNYIMLALGLLPLSALSGCVGQTHSMSPEKASTVTVMCNSTISHDTGFCQVRANENCGGKARLAGIISNVEMTGRPTGRLYTVTARYLCEAP